MDILGIPILTFVIFSPAIGIALISLFRDEGNGNPSKVIALLSCIVTFLLSLSLFFNFDQSTENFQMVEQYTWISKFNIDYFIGLDGLNLFFFILISFITPLALLGSWNLKNRNWQFQIQMLLLQIGMLGCFAALDVVLFYVFFEIMLIPMYLLIGIWGGTNRLYATIKFFTSIPSRPWSICLLITRSASPSSLC